MELIADFRADWVEYMRRALQVMGVKVKTSLSDEKLSHAFWNARFRMVPTHARTVLRAAEFTCPPQHLNGLEALARRFEQGEDVNPFLSKTRKIGKFNDKLLNDWGIQHFHIGMTAAERHDDCLFAKVMPAVVLFLHVLPHKRYTERDLIRRIHSNWPHVIERFKAAGALPSTHDLTDDEVQVLRDKNVLAPLQMPDGTIYVAPGGGLMSSGLSAQVLINSDAAFRQLKAYQAHIKDHLDWYLEQVHAQGRTPGEPPSFKLIVEANHQLYALEEASVVAFPLGHIFPPPRSTPPIDFSM